MHQFHALLASFLHTCGIFGFLGHCQDSPSSVQTWPPSLPTSASSAVNFRWHQSKPIEFMFGDINTFSAQLRLILTAAVRPGLKWALRRVKKIFMTNKINYFYIIITLEGIEKTKTEKKRKMTTKQSEEYFFHWCCNKTAKNTVTASRFWLAAYIVQLFGYHFSLVYFRGLKYNLANQILHNVQQNDNDRIYFKVSLYHVFHITSLARQELKTGKVLAKSKTARPLKLDLRTVSTN